MDLIIFAMQLRNNGAPNFESTWGGIKESLGINHLEIREGDENPHLEAKVKCPDDTQ